MDQLLYDPYGDPSHGDDLIPTDSFRYLFQNSRGKLITSSQKSSAIIALTDTNCSAFGIAESNLNWNFQHQSQYKGFIQHNLINSRSVFASCPIDPSVSLQPDYLPGGTFQSLKGAYGGRVVSIGADHMGRWSYQRLALKGKKHLLLITAYRSCIQAIEQGFTTTTAQQHRFMSARGVGNYLPRHQFLIDLLDFITDHQSLGDEVLLGIDANPAVGTDTQLDAFLQASNMLDLYEFRHGAPAPSTHDGGRTLDFIYGTTLLQQSFESVAYAERAMHWSPITVLCLPTSIPTFSSTTGMMIQRALGAAISGSKIDRQFLPIATSLWKSASPWILSTE